MTSPAGQTTMGPARQHQTVYWIIALLLAIIATALCVRPLPGVSQVALAQNQPLAGARGIFAFTGQLDRNSYGLFMLDVDQSTLWAYEIQTTKDGARNLRLVAARTFVYDRYLRDFNCVAPSFRDVQRLVEHERRLEQSRDESGLDAQADSGHNTDARQPDGD